MRQPDAILGAEQGKIRGPLFRKYVALFVAMACVALLANGPLEVWFSYQEHKASLVRIQREQAQSAARQCASRPPSLARTCRRAKLAAPTSESMIAPPIWSPSRRS